MISAVILAAAQAASPCASGAEPAAQAILDRRAAFNLAISRRDLDTIAGVLAEDVVLVTGTQSDVYQGRAAQLALWESDFARGDRLVYARRPGCIIPSAVSPIAMEHGSWQGRRPLAPGDSLVGHYAAKWRRVDGRWVIEAETYVTGGCSGTLCTSP